uniref:Uncharacterized protein n=1 Tax=Romanomermis culicivorax TaxID=13658 RepID=A0A915JWJ8_ROMCU
MEWHEELRTIYTCLFQQNERNGTECNRGNVTEGNGNFRSVRLDATVGRLPQNCSRPFRPKVDFQAESCKLLTMLSVPSKKANINGP